MSKSVHVLVMMAASTALSACGSGNDTDHGPQEKKPTVSSPAPRPMAPPRVLERYAVEGGGEVLYWGSPDRWNSLWRKSLFMNAAHPNCVIYRDQNGSSITCAMDNNGGFE